MKGVKRQREKGSSDTEEPERTSAKKSKTQVGFLLMTAPLCLDFANTLLYSVVIIRVCSSSLTSLISIIYFSLPGVE